MGEMGRFPLLPARRGFFVLVLLWFFKPSRTELLPDGHPLRQSLHHFDVLHRDHLYHRNVMQEQRSLVLTTLNRTFHLRLFPRRGLFEQGLAISIVGVNGSKRQHAIDPTQFYTGELLGEEVSRVTAHLDQQEGLLTASIYTSTEHYFIEPSHRHIHQSHDFHMISYRRSDLKSTFGSKQHCGTANPLLTSTPTSPLPPATPSPFSSHDTVQVSHTTDRQRRQAAPMATTSCPMLLVGATSFHQAYSPNSGVDSTIFFMVQVIDDISQHIFRPVQWNEKLRDYGLSIKNVTVFEMQEGSPAYNQYRPDWTSTQMLRLFSHHNWSDFCLAHLFTFQKFEDNRLGVAYPAATSRSLPGGICSPALRQFNGGEVATPNVALSSYRGDGGRILLLGEARLITAHEIAHNWGSEHDPTRTIGPCNPPLSSDDGKFLMFPFMSDGAQLNNDRFSPCSKEMIAQVLQAKSAVCFREEAGHVCGNYMIEPEEQCDAGLPGILNSDPCCTPECKLRESKRCSDVNHDCCTDCQVAPPTKVCRTFRPGNGQCLANVSCDGVTVSCPTSQAYVEVNTTCREQGRCLPSGSMCIGKGECSLADTPTLDCYGVCRLHNRVPCFCSGENECNVCCQDQTLATNSSICVPFSPVVWLPRGSFCIGGVCQEGQCKLTSPDLINRLFNLFTDISIDSLIVFFSENIVGTVLVFSVLLWILPGLAIHCFCDMPRLKKVQEQSKYFEEEQIGNNLEDLLDMQLVDDFPEKKKAVLTRGLSCISHSSRPPYCSLLSDGQHSTNCNYSIRHGYQPVSRLQSYPPPISRLQSQLSRTSGTDWDNFEYKNDS